MLWEWFRKMVFVKNGSLVVPGEPLCVAEEFIPGENTKLHKDGLILSIRSGLVKYDTSNHVVNVKPIKEVEEIKVGDTVLVEVKDVQDKIAIVRILSVNSKSLKHPRDGFILPRQRMRDVMKEYVGTGDLVVAQVISVFAGVIGLTIWKQGLGAVISLCDRCGGTLKRTKTGLVCTRCGHREKRKIVPYYGNLARIASMMR